MTNGNGNTHKLLQKNYVCRLMNLHGFNGVREAAVVHTAETVYPEPSGFDSQMTKIED